MDGSGRAWRGAQLHWLTWDVVLRSWLVGWLVFDFDHTDEIVRVGNFKFCSWLIIINRISFQYSAYLKFEWKKERRFRLNLTSRVLSLKSKIVPKLLLTVKATNTDR